jgi:AcrR family transcriptional regulator
VLTTWWNRRRDLTCPSIWHPSGPSVVSGTLSKTRADQRAETRGRLLKVAEATFLEKGYHGSSVALISERAGFSTGAIYSNFAGKEGLLLEVLDRHVSEQARLLGVAVIESGSLEDVLRHVSEWFEDLLTKDPRWTALEVEFTISAAGNRATAKELIRRHRVLRDDLAELIRGQSQRLNSQLPLEAGALAEAMLSLGEGLSVRRLLDKKSDAVVVFRKSLALLLGTELPSC